MWHHLSSVAATMPLPRDLEGPRAYAGMERLVIVHVSPTKMAAAHF